MKKRLKYIVLSAFAGILACVGDFVALFAFGTFFPGYSQLKDTVSRLGSSASPVSDQISLWWLILGFLFVFFAMGFYKEFSRKGGYAKIASVLIILYGLGEGIGSGAFKADHIATGLTTSGIIHETVGGIGVVAILLFPLIMKKVITRTENPAFYQLSRIIFVTGIFFILLFLFRYTHGDNFLAIYKGLWQRLFILNTYIYLSIIAIQMIKSSQNKPQQ